MPRRSPDRDRWRRAAVILTWLAAALAMIAAVSFLPLSAWYRDDECSIAQWKCDAGDLGLALFVLSAFLTVVASLVAAVAWCVHLVRRGES